MKQCYFIKKLYIFIDKIVRTQNNLTKKWHTNIDFSISDKKTIIQNIISLICPILLNAQILMIEIIHLIQ